MKTLWLLFVASGVALAQSGGAWTDFSIVAPASTNLYGAVNSKLNFTVASSGPGTCHAGADFWFDSGLLFHPCTATNTWGAAFAQTGVDIATSMQVVGLRGIAIPSLATGYLFYNGSTLAWVAGTGGVAWGAITGSIGTQADLAAALAAKQATLASYSTISGLTGYPTSFAPSAHNLLSAAHGDTTAASPTRGDGIFAIGASPLWTRLAHSAAVGGYFKWNGTDVVASTGAASGTGTCTNQVPITLNPDAAPTCGNVVAAMTDTSIAKTGVDVNTSNQVVGFKGVPLCNGYSPTNGQVPQYTTASSPNPCYGPATVGGGPAGTAPVYSTLTFGGSAPCSGTFPCTQAITTSFALTSPYAAFLACYDHSTQAYVSTGVTWAANSVGVTVSAAEVLDCVASTGGGGASGSTGCVSSANFVCASSIPGWVNDHCNVDTGLNSSSSTCADNAALINSTLSCASVGGTCPGLTLFFDVGTRISVAIQCPTNPACIIDGNGTPYSGVFPSNGYDFVPISPTFSGTYVLPTNPATAPPSQSGYMTVKNIHVNGNRTNASASCTGANPCVAVFLFGLQEAIAQNVTVANYPSYAFLFWNDTDFKAIHNTINGPGITQASTDGIHLIGPITTGHVEGNTLRDIGDDAMCVCAPELSGGNIGAVTYIGNVVHNVTQVLRIYNSISFTGVNGPQWTVGPIIIDGLTGDVNPTAGEHGYAFDWVGPSNACNNSTQYDSMSASISNVFLSGAYYGMLQISCRWGPVSLHNVIELGGSTNSAEFIKVTGDGVLTSLSVDHSGWEMTPTQNNSSAYLIEQGGLAQRIRIADPLCITQYAYSPGTPPCTTIIHTPTGGPATAFLEWAGPINGSGTGGFATQYSGNPNATLITGAENFIATPTISCSSAIAAKSSNAAGSFTGATASSCTITAGGSAFANTGWVGTLYDATAGTFIPPDPTAPYSTTTALFTGTIVSGHKLIYNLRPF